MRRFSLPIISSGGQLPIMSGFSFESSETSTSVQFTDESFIQPATAWEWKEGANIISTAQNPLVDLVTPGVYSVTLKVTDALANESTSDPQEVVVGVDIRITDDAGAVTIAVDSSLDYLSGTDVFESPTSLRDAHEYIAANPGSYEIDIQVDVKLFSNLKTSMSGSTVRHVSSSGQTIRGGQVSISNAVQSTFRNIRIYNCISDYTIVGGTSNDSLQHVNCGKVLIENCCIAMSQDEELDFIDCDMFVVQKNLIAYSMLATDLLGAEAPFNATGMIVSQVSKSAAITGVVVNNVFLCHQYRPLVSNGRFLFGGNWFMYYKSYQIFLANTDGPTDADILYNHYSMPFVGWAGDPAVGGDASSIQYYDEGNTQSGVLTDWKYEQPDLGASQPSMITLWPPVWRTSPTTHATVVSENGTSSHDDIEQQVLDDLMNVEINGATPADMPSNSSSIGYNCETGVKQDETVPSNMPDVLTWGRREVDGNELKIEIAAIQDDMGVDQVDTRDIDIDLIDGDGVVQWTGHAVIGETLAENTVVDNGIALQYGTMGAGEFLAWSLANANAVAASSTNGTLRIRATYRNPTHSVPSVSIARMVGN